MELAPYDFSSVVEQNTTRVVEDATTTIGYAQDESVMMSNLNLADKDLHAGAPSFILAPSKALDPNSTTISVARGPIKAAAIPTTVEAPVGASVIVASNENKSLANGANATAVAETIVQDVYEDDEEYNNSDSKQAPTADREFTPEERTIRQAYDRAAEDHYHLKALELEKMVEYIRKRHNKQIRLKDEEIMEQRQKAQKSKEAEDAAKTELQRTTVRLESTFRAQTAALRAEVERMRVTAQKTGGGGMGSSTSSFKSVASSLFGSGPSAKVQAKVAANQSERETARQIERLESALANERLRAEKHKAEAAEYLELASTQQFRAQEAIDENDKLRRFIARLEHKLRKYKEHRSKETQEKEDLVLKAGWAAEQLQAMHQELEWERFKRVPQSRVAIIKQVEELNALKEENEKLKLKLAERPKTGGKPLVADASAREDVVKPAKAAAPKEAKEAAESYVPPPPLPVSAPVEVTGSLGPQTIAELVALKARQREQRAVKLDVLIKKNRESRDRAKAEDDQADGGLATMMRKAIGSRRAEQDEDSDSLEMSSNEDSGKWA